MLCYVWQRSSSHFLLYLAARNEAGHPLHKKKRSFSGHRHDRSSIIAVEFPEGVCHAKETIYSLHTRSFWRRKTGICCVCADPRPFKGHTLCPLRWTTVVAALLRFGARSLLYVSTIRVHFWGMTDQGEKLVTVTKL